MKCSHVVLVAVSTGLLCSCTLDKPSTSVSSLPRTHTLMIQEFALTTTKPTIQLGQYTIKLVSIAADGVTHIRVAQTDKVLVAHPGDYFVSYEFGQEGLRLLSVTNGEAKFFTQGCLSH